MFAPDRLALLSGSPSTRLFLVDELHQLRLQLEEKRHLHRVWAGDEAPALQALDELLQAVRAGLDEVEAAGIPAQPSPLYFPGYARLSPFSAEAVDVRAALPGLILTPGGGTEPAEAALLQPERAADEEGSRTPRRVAARVLVVDDNPLVRRALGRVLSLGGYAVTLLPSAEEALAQAETEPPALALVDVQMEGLSGLELCLRLRELPRWRGVPILVMSGDDAPQRAQEALEAGANEFLRKPLDPEGVLRRVRSLLKA